MIDISSITEADRGRWVIYSKGPRTNRGRILRWNSRFIFVVFWCNDKWDEYENYTAAATRPEDVCFAEP
jgi:hypothetical protein